jgi:vacuolar iron transporter family protein
MAKEQPVHFKGKDPLEHVVENQARGIIDSTEIHGTEIPGHISAFADAARETALVLLLFWTILAPISFPVEQNLLLLALFTCGWLIWKAGRSGWLAWSRLERLHRVVAEEKWEIEHHRQQERDELRELYRAKGFEGKLLEDVLDVLMADGDRLLRVMVEEELGLTLEAYEHPLKQSLGAALGVLAAALLTFFGAWLFIGSGYSWGILSGSLLAIGLGAVLSAHYQGNKLIQAFVWNVALAILAYGTVHFLLRYALP